MHFQVSDFRRRNVSPSSSHHLRRHCDSDGGNRGFSHPLWGCGPREPPRSYDAGNRTFSLFVDFIPLSLSNQALRSIFEIAGRVIDVFISRKARKFRKEAFGFVRFSKLKDAKYAIHNLDGFEVNGRRLSVSMAKYRKGGALIERRWPPAEQLTNMDRRIKNPSLRENRKYIDVLMGKKQSLPKEDEVIKTIPISVTIHAAENEETVNMLNQAIIAENSEIINITKAKK